MIKKLWVRITNWFLADYLVQVQDSFQRARVRITFNFACFYIVLGIPPMAQFWLEGRFTQFWVTAVVNVCYISIPFILKYTQRLTAPALFFGFSGVVLLAVNNYFSLGDLSLLTGLWGIINVLYIYFTLRRIWGAVFMGFFALHILVYGLLVEVDYGFPAAQHLAGNAEPPLPIQFIPLIFIFYLITEYLRQGRRAEQELQFSITMESSLNRELEDQLIKLSEHEEELREAKLKAEKLARTRTDFLSNMSHEIRTPMNGVVGIANVLLEETPKPEQRENLEILKFSAENLLALIDNILDFNKLESGKMAVDVRPFQLHELLQRCVRLWEPNANRKGLTLTHRIAEEVPPWVVSDPFKLTQMINNLLNNAIRFTDRGTVSLAVAVAEEAARHIKLSITVADTGVGIPKGELDRVFDTFFQAHNNQDTSRGGTGLGLAIVKKLITLFDGTLTAESEEGKGTTIRLEYFFAKTEAPAEVAAMPGTKDPLLDRHILLVEDNVTNRLVARKILSRWSIGVEEAENGLLAVEALERFPMYDAILLDLQMPEMDGYATAEWIRSQDSDYFKNVPIIALTAAALPEVRERILNLGVDDFITKPFDPEELREKLTRVLLRREGN